MTTATWVCFLVFSCLQLAYRSTSFRLEPFYFCYHSPTLHLGSSIMLPTFRFLLRIVLALSASSVFPCDCYHSFYPIFMKICNQKFYGDYIIYGYCFDKTSISRTSTLPINEPKSAFCLPASYVASPFDAS